MTDVRTVDEIHAEKANGWVEFARDDYCHRCGRRNPIWHTSHDLWIEAVPDFHEALCPTCFVAALQQHDPRPVTVTHPERVDATEQFIQTVSRAVATLATVAPSALPGSNPHQNEVDGG